MLVQIYEVTSAEEARALTKLHVDHIGVLVVKGEFPREQQLKKKFEQLCIARSIAVRDEESISIAQSYDGRADMLLLDSHRPGDAQIGALGIPHSREIDRTIVERVRIPVIIAGGLGP